MTSGFNRVPAVDKCFAMLKLFAHSKKPLGVSDISKALNFNKSTVFNIVHTLDDLGVLEKVAEGKFQFGTRLYILGRAAGRGSELIGTVWNLVAIERVGHNPLVPEPSSVPTLMLTNDPDITTDSLQRMTPVVGGSTRCISDHINCLNAAAYRI